MSNVQETLKISEVELRGKAYDVLSYLEQELKRCPKMKMLEYIRLRRIEKAESNQFGWDIRGI